jgi:hypothetical protein
MSPSSPEPLKVGLRPAPRAKASAAKAEPRQVARPPISSGRRTGLRPLSAILPEVLLRLGVTMVQSNPSGETDPT